MTVRLTMGSRIGVVGRNGAGKSTSEPQKKSTSRAAKRINGMRRGSDILTAY